MLSTGALILRVLPSAGCPAPDLWYFPMLRPFVDHVPVRADLADLAQQIEWCRAHDEECQAIARRGAELHRRYLSADGAWAAQRTRFLGRKALAACCHAQCRAQRMCRLGRPGHAGILDYCALALGSQGIGGCYRYTEAGLRRMQTLAQQKLQPGARGEMASSPDAQQRHSTDDQAEMDGMDAETLADEDDMDEAAQMRAMGLPVSFGGGGSNRNRRNRRQQRQCYEWQRTGSCVRGDRCRFAHSATSGRCDELPVETSVEEITADLTAYMAPVLHTAVADSPTAERGAGACTPCCHQYVPYPYALSIWCTTIHCGQTCIMG
jgi:hypothetical protein